MPVDLIPVVSAFGGVLVGHVLSYWTMRSVKNREWRLSLAKDQIASRQRLYAEFLAEAQGVVVAAMKQKFSDPADLNLLNTKFAEITLLCKETVIDSARAIVDYALTCHTKAGPGEDARFYRLKEAFIFAAKSEIAILYKT